jgi:hypothetical protein
LALQGKEHKLKTMLRARGLFPLGLGRLGEDRFGEGVGFFLFEETVAATGDVFDGERAEANAVDFFDRVMLAKQQAAKRFELGAEHADFIPIVSRVAAHGVGLADDFHFDAAFLAETFDIGKGEHAFDLEVIGLLEMIPVFEKLRGEVTVIGHENEARNGVFEIAYGVDALGKATKKIAERFAPFGISERGDNFGRLVEEEINVAFIGIDGTTSSFDFVFGGICFGAEFGDNFAVDADLAGEDELFGVSTGGDAGTGDDFLKAFAHEEVSCQVSVLSCKCGISGSRNRADHRNESGDNDTPSGSDEWGAGRNV